MAMFTKLLIANRGEIACRIIRTARRMGITTIAVFSDADADALHVTQADTAIRIGPAAPRGSYLRIDAILAAARATGAQAIHPGYGFLSENAEFAEACAAAGLTFIGPPPSAIRAMGGKSQAKALMAEAGIPLVPGYHGEAQDLATLAAAANEIGYPVLIKASTGGGGKGMRVVESAAAFQSALEGAQREARSSFGDDRVLVERYLTRPRHIEIQIFADTHGNVLSLFERDCSIQRRHQKIIEEAPAPGMTPEMRRAMGEAAVAAARAVNYIGAGTVEFIAEGENFHFMEMNTRLQVEHPVTEAITGQDLVEWQLRVAAGEPLPLTQDELAITGHAIEIRLYAEDPARNFLPSIGTLTHLKLPRGVRVDAGVRQGDRITPDYDPMIAKIIAHAPDRATALAQLQAALAQTEVVGVQTNLPLLRALLPHPAFAAGSFDTGTTARHPELLAGPAATPPMAIAAAALAVLRTRATIAFVPADPHSPWSAQDSWRLNLPGHQTITLRHDETTTTLTATPHDDLWHLAWNGTTHEAAAHPHAGALLLRLGTTAARATVIDQSPRLVVVLDGSNHMLEVVDPHAPPESSAGGAGRVIAPIPGRVASLLVQPGDRVAKGQVLLVLEAMKMEIPLTAAHAGTIALLRCAEGEMVEEGIELVTFDEA
ncbi:MAG: acetyl-CoA carboxylase biotin carboxylase subunit [Acetobacteraceae bacterium]|nr:acetyl-CoA carboxylase biotin carboxylase subunit [Acetobacteraceae bacterium]